MILTGNGGTLPLNPISIFDISALCLILAYSVPPVCRTLAGPTGGRHDPCLHLRVDSLLGGSSEEVLTGSRGGLKKESLQVVVTLELPPRGWVGLGQARG